MGLLEAMHNLALLYKDSGDTLKSMAWFLEAAKLGFYPSVVNVGTLFFTGFGVVEANIPAAYIWLKVAQKKESSPQLEHMIAECEATLEQSDKKNRA